MLKVGARVKLTYSLDFEEDDYADWYKVIVDSNTLGTIVRKTEKWWEVLMDAPFGVSYMQQFGTEGTVPCREYELILLEQKPTNYLGEMEGSSSLRQKGIRAIRRTN